ncbi:MAG TPA: hydroxymethylbilane synthase, partial [Nitrosomonas sp.]|nr:hydroxymethylbilane synthase [Nitrosomonas sp.]
VAMMQPLHHPETAYCVEAERAMSRILGGSCQVPLGAFAEIIDDALQLRGFVSTPDGMRIVNAALSGAPTSGIEMGEELAHQLIQQGADKILASIVQAEGWK